MKDNARVQASIELLQKWQQMQMPMETLMRQYFRRRRYIGSSDRRYIGECCFRVLRRLRSYGWLLKRNRVEENTRNLVALDVHFNGHALEVIFCGDNYAPAKLSNAVIGLISSVDVTQLEYAPFAVRYNVPESLQEELKASLGRHFEEEMRAIQHRAAIDIRCNRQGLEKTKLVQKFSEMGIDVQAQCIAPTTIRLRSDFKPNLSTKFEAGNFEVQDESSQIAVALCDLAKADLIIDYCAGSGGKTLAFADQCSPQSKIIACDINDARLKQLHQRVQQGGYREVQMLNLSKKAVELQQQYEAQAGLVFVDAPCSGSGTWRRHPDLKWRMRKERVDSLIKQQAEILEKASSLVRPGGDLIYATCSLLHAENQHQVRAFLNTHPDFSLSPFIGGLMQSPKDAEIEPGMLQLLTCLHQTNGFFIARLGKQAQTCFD